MSLSPVCNRRARRHRLLRSTTFRQLEMAKSKKSPKKASKGSKGSSKSKGSKGSPEPPVESAMQTETEATCYLCCHSFDDHASLQSHLLLMNHFEPYSAVEQKCRVCHKILFVKHVGTHKCCITKGLYMRYVSSESILKQGPPYRCLFCRTEPFGSRIDLSTHLMCFHRPFRQLGCCGQCKFTFSEAVPKSSSLRPPPNDADDATKEQYELDLIKERDAQLLSMDIPDSTRELFKHIEEEHNNAFQFLAQKIMSSHCELRMPYSCVICLQIFKTNVEFQTHILARHGVDECIKYTHDICSYCKAGESTDDGFNIHARINHQYELVHNAKVWIDNEIMMNSTDCSTTCCTCWKTFKHSFQLQAHIIQCHTHINPMVCGFCGEDYSTCTDPNFGFAAFVRHEFNHSRELQRVALEMKHNFDPIPDKQEDGFANEDIEAYFKSKLDEQSQKSSKKSNKGSKKSNSKSKSKGKKKK